MTRDAAWYGQAIYTPLTLRVYDAWVLGLSNHLVWRCPTRRLLELYHAHLGAEHLEVGVGTGYLLDHARFPCAEPRLTLLDLNADSLAFTARRLARYGPTTLQKNLLEPLGLEPRYQSIGLNYVLHCLPGDEDDKSAVIARLRGALAPGGVLFGSTLLGDGTPRSPAARALMHVYNELRVFSNRGDTPATLERALARHFQRYTVELVGCAALFVAHA